METNVMISAELDRSVFDDLFEGADRRHENVPGQFFEWLIKTKCASGSLVYEPSQAGQI